MELVLPTQEIKMSLEIRQSVITDVVNCKAKIILIKKKDEVHWLYSPDN
jgi:hypothetical protein